VRIGVALLQCSFLSPDALKILSSPLITFVLGSKGSSLPQNNSSNITLLGDIVLILLKMMGHSETVPGVIFAEDVPKALSRLTAAIAVQKASRPIENKDSNESGVSIVNRAAPLINLLSPAAKANCDVIWD
jgi:hypothetical protein